MEPSVWLIAGPTASGKSALALRLAEQLGAEIVNADSMQLYAGLRVLAAAPTPAEAARVPHHLYGFADPSEAWSVGRWCRKVGPLLARLAAQTRPAVVVGGTGLYFRALTDGLANIPIPSSRVREEAATRLHAVGEAIFRAALAEQDAVSAARIEAGDQQRLLRAWSVLQATGRPLSAWQSDTRPMLRPGAYACVVLEPPRPTLYARCDARLLRMTAGGALEEVRALLQRRLSPELPAMKALGVREFGAHLQGHLSLEQALTEAQLQTRRYAKRQSTWFRNQTAHWPRIKAAEPEDQWRDVRALRARLGPA
jgi:tRNA dimethylallyltransferase